MHARHLPARPVKNHLQDMELLVHGNCGEAVKFPHSALPDGLGLPGHYTISQEDPPVTFFVAEVRGGIGIPLPRRDLFPPRGFPGGVTTENLFLYRELNIFETHPATSPRKY